MRVLWFDDAQQDPWPSGSDGWSFLKEKQIEALLCNDSASANVHLAQGNISAVVLRAEFAGSIDFFHELKNNPSYAAVPISAISATWSEEDFKNNSIQSANLFCKTPLDASQFVGTLAGIGVPQANLNASFDDPNAALENIFSQTSATAENIAESSGSADALLSGIAAEAAPAEAPAVPVDIFAAPVDMPTDASALPVDIFAAPADAPVEAPAAPVDLFAAPADAPAEAPVEAPVIDEQQVVQQQEELHNIADEVSGPIQTAASQLMQQNPDDFETVKKFLAIREHELILATTEKSELQKENRRLTTTLSTAEDQVREFKQAAEDNLLNIKHLEDKCKELEQQKMQDSETQQFDLKNAQEKIKHLEADLERSAEKYENLKVRVRKDIGQIKLREKELEAKLEMVRKDSSTLLGARDEQMLEMQRKIDALGFDVDQIQDSRVQAEAYSEKLATKLARAARAIHVALSMIEEDIVVDMNVDNVDELLGIKKEVVPPELPVVAAADTTRAMSATDVAAATDSVPPVVPPPAEAGQEEASAAEPEESLDLDALANSGDATRVGILITEDLGKATG